MKGLLALLLVAISSYRAVRLRFRMWNRPFSGFKAMSFIGRLDRVQHVYFAVVFNEETYYTRAALGIPLVKGTQPLTQYYLDIIGIDLMELIVHQSRLHGASVRLKASIPKFAVKQENGFNIIRDEYSMKAFCKVSRTPTWLLCQVLDDCRDYFFKRIVMDGHVPAEAVYSRSHQTNFLLYFGKKGQ